LFFYLSHSAHSSEDPLSLLLLDKREELWVFERLQEDFVFVSFFGRRESETNERKQQPAEPTMTSPFDSEVAEVTMLLKISLNEVASIDQMLDEYERTKDKKVLAEVTTRMKSVTGKLRDLSANPKGKTKENAPLLGNLSNQMKNLVARTKALAGTTTNEETKTFTK
jgi:hypothetical protein